MDFKTVQCRHCGWIHMAVSRAYAEAEVKSFNEYFNSLSKKKQDDYYGGKPSGIAQYEYCRCGKLADMIEPTKTLMGSTIGPIIWEQEI